MPFPTGDEEGVSNIELMHLFLGGLQELLGNVLAEGRDANGQLLFYKELFPPLRMAFFDEMDSHFVRLHQAIEKIPEAQIQEHALAGQQLSLKLHVVRFFADRFAVRGGPGPFRKLLGTLEGLLDSIIDAAGAGGAIKEFKEFVRSSAR